MAKEEGTRIPEDQVHQGRLELTWTNKELCLLADEDGSYRWVPPTDYRVAEVRLLDDAGTVGKTYADRSRARDNLLIRGDALTSLRSLAELPEFAREYAGQVKLAYLDPPFNTGQSFLHYDDALEHSVWLTMLRDRLEQIQNLLAPDGSVWVHCDDSEQAYLRVMMDELFGRNNYVATVVWQTRTSRENRAAIGVSHNYLHIYSPAGSEGWREVRNRLARNDGTIHDDGDPRGPWESVPFTAQGFRKNQMYKVTTPTGAVHDPPKGRCWAATEPEFKKLLDDGRIHFPREGKSRPRVKQFVSDAKGLVPMTWWPVSEVGDNEEAKKEILALFPDVEAFDTPKPERLLQRIIHIATDPGDIVLDCFLGSGTTAAVAQKMGRRWVGIERSEETLDRYGIPRLTKVVESQDPGGVTEDQDWNGGGGFRILDVAPSMFEEDRGVVLLADWATNGKLSEVTAAQMGYDFIMEPPFTGTKGRSLLAVVDGLVSDDVVELLGYAAGPENRVVACGTAISPSAGEALREIRPGSTVRKIPASILEEYRQARWSPAVSGNGADQPTKVKVADSGENGSGQSKQSEASKVSDS